MSLETISMDARQTTLLSGLLAAHLGASVLIEARPGRNWYVMQAWSGTDGMERVAHIITSSGTCYTVAVR